MKLLPILSLSVLFSPLAFTMEKDPWQDRSFVMKKTEKIPTKTSQLAAEETSEVEFLTQLMFSISSPKPENLTEAQINARLNNLSNAAENEKERLDLICQLVKAKNSAQPTDANAFPFGDHGTLLPNEILPDYMFAQENAQTIERKKNQNAR